MTVQTEGDGEGFMTDSTIADTTSVVSVQSSVSTRSSRSGLTRQGNFITSQHNAIQINSRSLYNIWCCTNINLLILSDRQTG